MKIIGFHLKKVLAEKISPLKGKLEIKQGLNIEDITEEKASFSDKPTLKFDFNFSIDYNPDIAKLELKGSVLVLDEKEEAKEIIKDWKKKKFEHPIKLALFNFIMDRCNIKALNLQDELNLPFHIPFPKLAPQPKQNDQNPANYAG